MKRTRPPSGPAPRALRRKNVVQDSEEEDAYEEDERMSGGEGGEEEEEEDEGDDDEEDEDEEDEEEEEEEEEEADQVQVQRRRTSDRTAKQISAAPSPKKKPLRRGAAASNAGVEDENDDGEQKRSDNEGGSGDDEDEDQANESGSLSGGKRMTRRGAAAVAPPPPPRRNDRPPRDGMRRNKIVDENEDAGKSEDEKETSSSTKSAKQKKRGRGVVNESASDDDHEDENKNDENDDDDGENASSSATPMEMDVDDVEDTRSESTPLATPSASPVRRSGMSIDALVHSTPTKTGSTGDTNTNTLPFQHLHDRLRDAPSEQALLDVISSVCSNLIKEGKAPNRLFAVALLSAVKEYPTRFQQPAVVKYLLRLLRSKHYVTPARESSGADPQAMVMKKNGPSSLTLTSVSGAADSSMEMPLPVVIANIILHFFQDQDKWPEDTFKVFLDDALHGRVWVDHEFSAPFVHNVKTMLHGAVPVDASPLVRVRAIDGKDRGELRELAMKHIRLRLHELEKERTQAKGARPMVLALIDFVSIPDARVIAAENLDTWLQNPSTKGPAKELLTKVVAGCKTMEAMDLRAVDLLFKLKLKPTMFQVKVETITQLIRQHPGYLRLALSLFISRERPNNMGKDVDNMKMLQQIFRSARTPPSAATVAPPGSTSSSEESFYTMPAIHVGAVASRDLGFVFRDLASSSEVAPVLKTMVRKIIKQLGFDNVDMKTLCVEILKNDDHWDALAKYADMRLLDYAALVTGTVWLVLLMRGSAVKNLQIQQMNAGAGSARQDANSGNPLGGVVKLGGAQPIPRRAIQSVGSGVAVQGARVSKLGAGGGGFGKGKAQLTTVAGKMSPSTHGGIAVALPTTLASAAAAAASASASASAVPGSSTGALPVQHDAVVSKAVKVAVKAKEELQQTLAFVQRQALVTCHEIFHKFGLTGKSAFEKSLYELIVKKLLFLEIPPDVQPTEHDKTCFLSTKEDLPLHEDSLEMLTNLLSACESVDRVEALRTLEAIVFRAAEGHMKREELWGLPHADDLLAYGVNGGVLGLHVTRTAFVVDLLRLTSWTNDQKMEHEFCYSSRFWICCTILLIIGSFNPTTVGDFLWRETPTLRALMQMLITGRFDFPCVTTPDPELFGGHRDNFTDLHQANAQLKEYEQHVMVSLAPTLEDPLMLFEIQGVARQPPPAIIDHLKVLDRKFHLGTRLRQSRTKDFLMEMVTAGNDSSGAAPSVDAGDETWWIAEIVCEDVYTVQYLPYECLCRLLLLARRGSSLATAHQDGNKTRQLIQIVPRLQFKLREFLADTTQIEKGAQVVLYFLDCLVTGSARDRRVASQILAGLTRDDSDQPDSSTSSGGGQMTTPKSDTDSNMDDTASSTLPPLDGMVNPLEEIHNTMNFEWLGALLKLPCYDHVRDKVFIALESLLDQESSIVSLSSCIKALYAVWKDACDQYHQDAASSLSSTAKSKATAAPQPRLPSFAAAADATFQLAATFGRLLSSREFVCRHLLQHQELCSIFAEIFWTAISFQLRPDPDRSAGLRLSDCKVFYATDGSSTVKEIKLPVPVIHGAIRVLCTPSPPSTGSGAIAYEKLSDCLFPKVKKDSNTAILSSTGVIATKDKRLYPEELLKKMVQYAGSPHLVVAATKGMSVEMLWELIGTAGLSAQSLSAVVRSLCDVIRGNEAKAIATLQTATKQATASAAADAVACSLATSLHRKSMMTESDRFLHDWINQKRSAKQRDDTADETEQALLSSGFAAAVAVTDRKRVAFTMPSFNGDQDEEMTPSKPQNHVSPGSDSTTQSDWSVFTKSYPIVQLPQASAASPPLGRGSSSLAAKITNLVLGSCAGGESCPESDADAESTSWSRRIAVLHCMRAACNSSTGASRLGDAVLAVVDHMTTCTNTLCLTECTEFVKQSCDMVERSFSLSAMESFLTRATRITTLSSTAAAVHRPTSRLCGDKQSQQLMTSLSLLLKCFDDATRRWHAMNYRPTLDPWTLHNLIVLTKDTEILRRARQGNGKPQPPAPTTSIDCVSLLTRLVDSRGENNDTTLVCLLDALLSADPQLACGPQALHHHDFVRKELVEALYFNYPRAVSGHLDVLHPSWKATFNPRSRACLFLPRQSAASVVDTAVSDLRRESSDAVDKLRELAVREPVLVQNRVLALLHEWKGEMSLTLLYQKSGVFHQIICVVDTLLPSFVHDASALDVFLVFVFEIVETIARHQAAEFYQLMARLVACLADALTDHYEVVAEALFTPARLNSLRDVASIYESVAEIAAFTSVVEQPQSETHVRDALTAVASARNKTVASSEDQRQVRAFVDRIHSSAVISTAFPMAEIDVPLTLVMGILTKAQEMGTCVPLLTPCAESVARLLAHDELTKAAMKSVCQVLLALMRHDPAHAVRVIMPQYVRCLGSVRLVLRESALAYVTEFLALADSPHRRAILEHLYDDPCEVAKSKLVAFVKSAAFKTQHI